MNDYITIALTKGRLADQTMKLLGEAGYYCEELKDKSSRKLIFVNEEQKLRFFLAKGPDVPTYVEYGAADIGVVAPRDDTGHFQISEHCKGAFLQQETPDSGDH